MKINDIKDPQIRALAWKYRKANNDEYYDEDTVREGFNWLKTKEGAEFWVDVCIEKPIQITEKMKADHPEIFLKQEEMKTTHTLKNGTVLEVGKKYKGTQWSKEDTIIFTEILHFGIEKAFLRNNENEEYECLYKFMQDLIPYEEPKEKVKLTKFYCSDDNKRFVIEYLKNKNLVLKTWYYIYTEKEFLEKFDVEI